MPLVKILFFLSLLAFSLAPAHAKEEYNADIRFLHVQKGQTLNNIIRRLYPERKSEWPKLSSDIVRLNPHAFVDSDPQKMKAGVRLKLPQKIVVRAIPATPSKRVQVGTVTESSGSVIAVNRKVSRDLSKDSPVFLGDKVVTGEFGFVRLIMIDDAVLDLSCFSIMVIEQYALKAGNRRSILNLLQGSLKKITGNIGKMADDIYELKTPLASVGVRGTEYALRVFQNKGCGGTLDADDGFYLEVIKGLVTVHNEAGAQVIAKGETAIVPLPAAKPQKQEVKSGIINPVKTTDLPDENEESSSMWWWLLGVVALVILI